MPTAQPGTVRLGNLQAYRLLFLTPKRLDIDRQEFAKITIFLKKIPDYFGENYRIGSARAHGLPNIIRMRFPVKSTNIRPAERRVCSILLGFHASIFTAVDIHLFFHTPNWQFETFVTIFTLTYSVIAFAYYLINKYRQ